MTMRDDDVRDDVSRCKAALEERDIAGLALPRVEKEEGGVGADQIGVGS